MTVTVRFQSLSQPLTLVSNVKEIPKDATIIWYDFENATDEENEYLKNHFDFNYLEIDDAINGDPRVKYKEYMIFHSIINDDYSPISLSVFLEGNVLVTYHHKHFPSLKRVAQYNAENHDSELDCADIVIHILDCMVDKYFNFVYGIEDKVYNFEAKHVDDRYSKSVMENVFQLRSDLIKIKRVLFPMQEVVDTMKQEGNIIKDAKHRMYIQHIDDHLIKQRSVIRTSQK